MIAVLGSADLCIADREAVRILARAVKAAKAAEEARRAQETARTGKTGGTQ